MVVRREKLKLTEKINFLCGFYLFREDFGRDSFLCENIQKNEPFPRFLCLIHVKLNLKRG